MEGRHRQEMKSFAAEPTDGAAGGRLGTLPARRGHRRRVDVPLRGQHRLLERRPARRRGRLPRLQERGPGGPGADQGRGRLRRGHLRAAGLRRWRAATASLAHNGDTPGLRRDLVQRRLGGPQDRRAHRRPEPGRARPGLPLRPGLALDSPAAGRQRLPGRRLSPGRRIVPPGYRTFHWEPPGRGPSPTTPNAPPTLLDEAGYTARRRRSAHAAGRLPDRHAAAVRPLRLRHLDRHDGLLPGVAGRPRHRRPRSPPWSPAS